MINHVQVKEPKKFNLRNYIQLIIESYLSDLVWVEKVFVAEAGEGDAATRLLLVQSVEIVQKIFKSHSLKILILQKLLIREGSGFQFKVQKVFQSHSLKK